MKKALNVLLVLCLAPAAARALDTAALDRLLLAQDYKELTKQLGERNDPETLAYLRSRYMEWHHAINAHFYAIQYLPAVLKRNRPDAPSLTREALFEATSAWSRAKTALFVDRSECKEFTPQVRYWTEGFNIMSEPMQMVLGNYPAAMFKFGSEALEWAKKLESARLPPPAVWLCGEGNVRADRAEWRQRAIAQLERQLQAVTGDEKTSNPSPQGTPSGGRP